MKIAPVRRGAGAQAGEAHVAPAGEQALRQDGQTHGPRLPQGVSARGGWTLRDPARFLEGRKRVEEWRERGKEREKRKVERGREMESFEEIPSLVCQPKVRFHGLPTLPR